jgi:hypothetical protein
MVSIALMTLSNSIRVLLPTAWLSDQVSDHDGNSAQPCVALRSQIRLQLLRETKDLHMSRFISRDWLERITIPRKGLVLENDELPAALPE